MHIIDLIKTYFALFLFTKKHRKIKKLNRDSIVTNIFFVSAPIIKAVNIKFEFAKQ